MESNQNLLTAYAFLAALTENQNDLFSSVYIPICKRALSLYSAKRKSHGTINDIQEIIVEEFNINIPNAFIKRLFKAISHQMSNKERSSINFSLFENGQQFSIGRYAFSDLEFKLKKGKREAAAVQKAFEAFLKEEQIPTDDVPMFVDFLQKNNGRLASFFSNKKDVDIASLENSYYYHVEFLKFLESGNHQLYSIIESMYLGSIVVSFIEADFDFEAKFLSGETYYVDTPFVLRALDLQKEDDCKAAQELISLIKATGGNLKVLSITVDELHGILDKAIYSYNSKAPTSTINEACQRKGINKTNLIQLAGDLESELVKRINLTVEVVTNEQKEKYNRTRDLKLLQDRRTRAGTAEHDVFAYLYVRDKRNGVIQSYQKAKVWLLTTNTGLLKFNRETMPYQGISEIVLPDALTSLLWLRNPLQLASKVKHTGLNELMSVTIGEEVASKELISEFEATISSIQEITSSDYKVLLNSVAYESAKRIEKFIDKSLSDPEKAAIEAQRIIEKERKRRNNEHNRLKEANTTIKKEQEDKFELNDKIAKIESDLVEFSNANSQLRTIRDQNLTAIENLQKDIVEYKKFTKRWLLWLFIFILVVVASFFLWNYRSEIISSLLWIGKGILTISGLWSFGSFIINLIKAFKKK